MKKTIIVCAALLIAASVFVPQQIFAQAPEKMSYQAVVRNSSNALVVNQAVGMQISIIQGSPSGSAVYVETHVPTANANGLVSLEIGEGTVISGNFSTIDWADGPYFIQTETDPNGGTSYSITGTSELLSVPYALHARTAETLSGGIVETDPVFGASIAAGITAADTASWNLDNDPTNEIQSLSYDGTTGDLSLSGANSINIPTFTSPWTVDADTIYRENGIVGIMNNNPQYPLHITWAGVSGPDNETRGIVSDVTAQNTDFIWRNSAIQGNLNTVVTQGRAINGSANGPNFGIGVVGESFTPDAQGVVGYAWGNPGDNTVKTGVVGLAQTESTAAHRGGLFQAAGQGGGANIGVVGIAVNGGTGDHYGSIFQSEGQGTLNIASRMTSFGGAGDFNLGILSDVFDGGTGTNSTAIYARSLDGTGNDNNGVFGFSNGSGANNIGLYGSSEGNGTWNEGVAGISAGSGENNIGVFARAEAQGSDPMEANVAVWGVLIPNPNATENLAGKFTGGNVLINGDLEVTGNISKGGGTFKIDHPLDPENKYLVHSFIESPDMMNVYNGNIQTDANGFAIVELPEYFEAANKDFRYQLTVIGTFAQAIVAEEIAKNSFKIQTNEPNVKVSWQVTGIRNDPYAVKNRIVPVQEKSDRERGKYLHNDLYNGSPIHDDSKAKERIMDGNQPLHEKAVIETPLRNTQKN
jgi:hypothetical protein